MFCFPFLQLDVQPEAINAAGDQRQQEPFDPVAKKLTAVAIKGQTLSVNHSMTNDELHHVTNRPGSRNAASDRNNQDEVL